MENKDTSNPIAHTANIKKEFKMLIEHLREDVTKVNDAAAKALFETSAEVLIGLEKRSPIMKQKMNRRGKAKRRMNSTILFSNIPQRSLLNSNICHLTNGG